MKIIWLQVFLATDKESFSVALSEDLSSFGYFQRSTVREHLVFASRTSCTRCPPGTRITIALKEVPYKCHCYRKINGLAGIAISDNEYPDRVCHSLINRILNEFEKKFTNNEWKKVTKDENFDFPVIAQLLKEYQDPKQADKYMKIQQNLDDIKDIMHKNLEEILRRGETLDVLLQKSDDIGEVSKMFHQKAKKNNQCCQWY